MAQAKKKTSKTSTSTKTSTNVKKTTSKKPTAKSVATKTKVSKKPTVDQTKAMAEDRRVGLIILALLIAAAAAIVWYTNNESNKLENTYTEILKTNQAQEVPVTIPVEANSQTDSEDSSN